MKGKKILKGFGIVLAVLIVLRVGLAFIWPTINDVRTGATPEYADLQAQRFKLPPIQVFEATIDIAKEAGWEITAQDAAKGEIRAVATSSLWKFKDDITVTLSVVGDEVVVNVHSRSRVGKGDLGANARRIRQFQAELAKRFS